MDLSRACRRGDLEEVKHLIRLRADIFEKDPVTHYYPHETACCHGSMEVLKYLVSKGADVTADDNWSIHTAISNGHLNIVKYLISIGVAFEDSRNGVLVRAVMQGQSKIVKCLLDCGADIGYSDHLAMRRATEHNHMISGIVLAKYMFEEMKRYTLLTLLNASTRVDKPRIIHRDLVRTTLRPEYIGSYKYYLRKMK